MEGGRDPNLQRPGQSPIAVFHAAPDRQRLENVDPVFGLADGMQLTGDRFTSRRWQRSGDPAELPRVEMGTGGHKLPGALTFQIRQPITTSRPLVTVPTCRHENRRARAAIMDLPLGGR